MCSLHIKWQLAISCSRSSRIFRWNFSIKKFYSHPHNHCKYIFTIECGLFFCFGVWVRNAALTFSVVRCLRVRRINWDCVLTLSRRVLFNLYELSLKAKLFIHCIFMTQLFSHVLFGSATSFVSDSRISMAASKWQWQQIVAYLQRFCGLLHLSITIPQCSLHFVDFKAAECSVFFNNVDIYLSLWLDLQQLLERYTNLNWSIGNNSMLNKKQTDSLEWQPTLTQTRKTENEWTIYWHSGR